MTEIINRTIAYAGMPALTPTEQGDRAKAWTELLFDTIPEHRLMDCLIRAGKDHTSLFAINVHELKNAWDNIDATERRAAAEAKAKNEYSVETCKDKQRHIVSPDGDQGMVEYVDWFDRTKDVILPCDICRPHAHKQARERHIEKNGGKDLGPVEVEKLVQQVADRFIPPETADEIPIIWQTYNPNEYL